VPAPRPTPTFASLPVARACTSATAACVELRGPPPRPSTDGTGRRSSGKGRSAPDRAGRRDGVGGGTRACAPPHARTAPAPPSERSSVRSEAVTDRADGGPSPGGRPPPARLTRPTFPARGAGAGGASPDLAAPGRRALERAGPLHPGGGPRSWPAGTAPSRSAPARGGPRARRTVSPPPRRAGAGDRPPSGRPGTAGIGCPIAARSRSGERPPPARRPGPLDTPRQNAPGIMMGGLPPWRLSGTCGERRGGFMRREAEGEGVRAARDLGRARGRRAARGGWSPRGGRPRDGKRASATARRRAPAARARRASRVEVWRGGYPPPPLASGGRASSGKSRGSDPGSPNLPDRLQRRAGAVDLVPGLAAVVRPARSYRLWPSRGRPGPPAPAGRHLRHLRGHSLRPRLCRRLVGGRPRPRRRAGSPPGFGVAGASAWPGQPPARH
jgi:hypothetical protein